MARVFECISSSGTAMRDYVIQPYREALWAAAFEVDTLDGLFDMTPAEAAIPVIDAAVARFNTAPEELRAHWLSEDLMGLRGNRGALLSMRTHLATLGGTISGAVDSAE